MAFGRVEWHAESRILCPRRVLSKRIGVCFWVAFLLVSWINDAEAAFKQERFDQSESLEIVHATASFHSSACATTWTEPRTWTLKHDLYTRRQRRSACERGRTGLDGAQNGGRHALLLFSVIWYATPHPRSQARNLEPCTETTSICEIAVRFFCGMRWGEEGFPPMFLSANHQ